MDKKIIIGITVVAIITIIVVIVACVMKKEKFVSGQTGDVNLLAADTSGNLSVVSSVAIANSLNLATKTGMTRYVGSKTMIGPSGSTAIPQNSVIFTMPLSNLTPGNTLLVTVDCPIRQIIVGPGNNFNNPTTITLTAAVGASGKSQSLTFDTWSTNNIGNFCPISVYTVTSDPAGSSTQTLTITAASNKGSTLFGNPTEVSFTCTVLEVL